MQSRESSEVLSHMHLQQTKDRSLRSGGPQYFFHSVTPIVKEFLRRRHACPVVLMTPYGIAPSPFMAVGRDHKLTDDGEIVAGRVGHDRIQQAKASRSIGEEIRLWHSLPGRIDFERIEVDVSIHEEGHFILTPTRVHFRGQSRPRELEKPVMPLSFNHRHESSLWRKQITAVRDTHPEEWAWVISEISRVVADHRLTSLGSIHEADLQRTAGAFSKLGLKLGPYLLKGYDCASRFEFARLPVYECPVEIKKRSHGFHYQMDRYKPLPRAVILCLEHDLVNVPDHIDVIELGHFARSPA